MAMLPRETTIEFAPPRAAQRRALGFAPPSALSPVIVPLLAPTDDGQRDRTDRSGNSQGPQQLLIEYTIPDQRAPNTSRPAETRGFRVSNRADRRRRAIHLAASHSLPATDITTLITPSDLLPCTDPTADPPICGSLQTRSDDCWTTSTAHYRSTSRDRESHGNNRTGRLQVRGRHGTPFNRS